MAVPTGAAPLTNARRPSLLRRGAMVRDFAQRSVGLRDFKASLLAFDARRLLESRRSGLVEAVRAHNRGGQRGAPQGEHRIGSRKAAPH